MSGFCSLLQPQVHRAHVQKRGDLFTNSANVLHVFFFSLKGEVLNQYMRNPSAPDNSAPMCHFGLEKMCLSYNDLHCFMLDL